MGTVAELRARIASGEVKAAGGGVKGVGEGLFLCSVEGVEYGKGNEGNLRGAIKCKVLTGGTDKDVGGIFNIYLQTVNEGYAEQALALWIPLCAAWGISEDKIYDSDCENVADIIGSLCTLINKLALKGGLRLQVARKLSGKTNAKTNRPYYYSDPKEASRASTAPAPATAPAAPQAAAPAAAPAAQAAPAAAPKKAWMK